MLAIFFWRTRVFWWWLVRWLTKVVFGSRRTVVSMAGPPRRPGTDMCICGGNGCPHCGWSGWR